jgi:SAM-dependent methyltransferase
VGADEAGAADQQSASHAAAILTSSSAVSASSASAPVAGNVYDKYASSNPAVRRLMRSFFGALDDLLLRADPADVLDVGCGEGVVTRHLVARLGGRRVVGLDRDVPALRAAWAGADGPEFVTGDAQALPYADAAFDLVALVEMLQLVDDPGRALAQAARVARRWMLVTVPREPLWRALNVARGAYVRRLGNTPGHRHHWSRRAVLDLVAAHGEVVAVRSPLPWTLALVSMR